MYAHSASASGGRANFTPFGVLKDIHTPLSQRTPISAREYARHAIRSVQTLDHASMTFDAAMADAAGVFLNGELERLDQRLNGPLASVTYTRDIDFREDVTIADERTSYTNSSFGSPQGIPGSNKAWVGKESNNIPNVSLDIGKTVNPLNMWAVQLSWTIRELRSAEQVGRPVDEQKYQAMMLKHQMDCDEMVYVGDSVLGLTGMFNHTLMSNTGNAATGNWASATPSQILADVNSLLNSVWGKSVWAVMPNRLLLSPTEFSLLVSTPISSLGNISIIKYLLLNNLAAANNRPLEIQPTKWLLGTNNANTLGVAATNSMYAYVKEPMRIRWPYVPLQRTPLEWRTLWQMVTYYGLLGAVELPYQETTGLRSNLG